MVSDESRAEVIQANLNMAYFRSFFKKMLWSVSLRECDLFFSLPTLTSHFQSVLPAAAEFSSPQIHSDFPPNLASLGSGVLKSSVETRLSNLECAWSQKGRSMV